MVGDIFLSYFRPPDIKSCAVNPVYAESNLWQIFHYFQSFGKHSRKLHHTYTYQTIHIHVYFLHILFLLLVFVCLFCLFAFSFFFFACVAIILLLLLCYLSLFPYISISLCVSIYVPKGWYYCSILRIYLTKSKVRQWVPYLPQPMQI